MHRDVMISEWYNFEQDATVAARYDYLNFFLFHEEMTPSGQNNPFISEDLSILNVLPPSPHETFLNSKSIANLEQFHSNVCICPATNFGS